MARVRRSAAQDRHAIPSLHVGQEVAACVPQLLMVQACVPMVKHHVQVLRTVTQARIAPSEPCARSVHVVAVIYVS